MRILFVTAETYPTFRVDVAILFGKYLPQLGVHSDIVAGKTPGVDGTVVWGGGDAFLSGVTNCSASKHFKTLLNGIQIMWRAHRSRYQAIQVRDLPLLATIGLLISRFKRLHFYYWMSYPVPEGYIALARERGLSAGLARFIFPWVRGQIGRILLYNIVLPWADHIFVQSDCMKQILTLRGVSAGKMTTVPMGVDVEAVQSEEIQSNDDERLNGKRVIVYLGTLDRTRHIEVLFEMLAQIRQHIPQALLVLVGDTTDKVHREWLKRQAVISGVEDHVLWTGWLPMRVGWSYVRAAEVALSPIPRGPLLDVSSPTKMTEYLVLGVPIVCNDNPDQESIIRICGAGRCVPYMADSFAVAVVEMMNMDGSNRLRCIDAGRRYVSSHRDYRHIAESVASVYKKLSVKI